jgi:predicted nucleotidyltransferase
MYNNHMRAEQFLGSRREGIEALCRKYAVTRLRLFGSALSENWDPDTSDFDFLAEFGPPAAMNAFDRYMGFVLDLEALLGRKVDVVDWNAAKNPFFKRHAERSARELYAS